MRVLEKRLNHFDRIIDGNLDVVFAFTNTALHEARVQGQAAELQESQPDDELAGHLVKARRKSEVADEADLDELDFISRSTAFISKSIFGSAPTAELRV